jgi:tetratricopeptide (TPR) repeat protein
MRIFNYKNILFALWILIFSYSCFANVIDKKSQSQKEFNKAIDLGQLKKYEEAIKSYDLAIKHQPDYLEDHCNKGIGIDEKYMLDISESNIKKGLCLDELKRYKEDIESSVKPTSGYLKYIKDFEFEYGVKEGPIDNSSEL